MGYLDSLAETNGRKPPEGAFTVADATRASGLGQMTVRRKLAADEAAGRLESDIFLVRGHETRYYWEAGNAKVRKR